MLRAGGPVVPMRGMGKDDIFCPEVHCWFSPTYVKKPPAGWFTPLTLTMAVSRESPRIFPRRSLPPRSAGHRAAVLADMASLLRSISKPKTALQDPLALFRRFALFLPREQPLSDYGIDKERFAIFLNTGPVRRAD